MNDRAERELIRSPKGKGVVCERVSGKTCCWRSGGLQGDQEAREEDAYYENRNIITSARVALARFPSNSVGAGADVWESRGKQRCNYREIMNEHMRSVFSQLLSQLPHGIRRIKTVIRTVRRSVNNSSKCKVHTYAHTHAYTKQLGDCIADEDAGCVVSRDAL